MNLNLLLLLLITNHYALAITTLTVIERPLIALKETLSHLSLYLLLLKVNDDLLITYQIVDCQLPPTMRTAADVSNQKEDFETRTRGKR
jgi:hypothetical protein